ncbi:MAG: putative hemagglutinin-related protein [Planctomycetota bacterium]|nr:putative hemagglutinin-related protein [Planctomycetota bacterium]
MSLMNSMKVLLGRRKTPRDRRVATGASLAAEARKYRSHAAIVETLEDRAMLSLTGISVAAQVGALTYGTAGSVTFVITVTRGNNGSDSIPLFVTTTLPSGATSSFSPTPISFSGNTKSETSTLTISTSATTPAATTTFTVQASGNGTVTNTGTLTEGARALTITAATNSKVYDGTTNATATPTITSGSLVNGNTATLTEAYASKNAGTGLSLVPSASISDGNSGNNYAVTLVNNSTGIITTKALTANGVSAPQSKVYNGTTAAAVSGLATLQAGEIPGSGTSGDGRPYTGDTVSLTGTVTGTYNSKDVATATTVTFGGLSLTGTSSVNYSFAPPTQSATITPKALTASGLSVPASRIYDGTTAAVVSGTASLQATEAAGSGSTGDGKPYNVDSVGLTGTPTGTYNSKDVATAATVTFGGLSLTGAGNTNYTLTPATQAATITTKALTASGLSVPASRPYNGTTAAVVSGTAALQATEAAGSGSTGDGKPYNVDSVSLAGTATGTYNSKDVATATTVTFGGLSLTGTGNANYTLTPPTQAATITKAALTATADNKGKVYGAADPALTYTLSGTLFSPDTAAVVSGVILSTTTGAAATAGTHAITASGGTAANYAVTTANGTLTVTKAAALTATADDQGKVYGAADPTLTYTVTGVTYYGDSAQAVVSGVILSTTTGAAATAGTHAITASGGTAANYAVTTANGTLTVTKAAALTATADDQGKVYGAADPTLTYTVTGVTYYGDVAQSVVSGVILSTTTGAAATAGTHTITASGGTAANYEVNTANGTLNVSQAPLTVTASDRSKTYGTTLSLGTSAFTTSALPYGETVGSVTLNSSGATNTAPVGSYPIIASAATGGTFSASNYGIIYADGSLTVNPAVLIMTANNQNMGHGDAVPTLTYALSGFVNNENPGIVTGTANNSTTGTSTSSAGYYPITAGVGTLTAPNYTISPVNGQLTIHPKVADVRIHWGIKTISIVGLNRNLPFFNITALDVLFTDDVSGVSGNSGITLTSTNGGPSYAFNSNSYAANDAVRGLPSAIGIDKLSLAVSNGITAAGFPAISIYGQTAFGFNVLPGDFNNDGQVTASDSTQVRNLIAGVYNVWADVNGDGVVDAADVNLIRAKVGTHY